MMLQQFMQVSMLVWLFFPTEFSTNILKETSRMLVSAVSPSWKNWHLTNKT